MFWTPANVVIKQICVNKKVLDDQEIFVKPNRFVALHSKLQYLLFCIGMCYILVLYGIMLQFLWYL